MRKIPKPKYKIWDILVGHCHPAAAETIMIEVESAHYDGKYGKWAYVGTYDNEKVEMWEYDVDYSFKD